MPQIKIINGGPAGFKVIEEGRELTILEFIIRRRDPEFEKAFRPKFEAALAAYLSDLDNAEQN